MEIAKQRCFNHRVREAVAVCPECRRYFCRECVTEHKDRVICAACLRASQTAGQERISLLHAAFVFLQAVFSFILLWFLFYGLARILLYIPSSFHEGNLWREVPWG